MVSIKRLLQINNNYLKKNHYLSKFNFTKIKQSTPWFTLPCNKFLTLILNKKYKVFEFGSGSSTFFFATKCKKVFSCEYYENFYKRLIPLKKYSSNIHFIHPKYSDFIINSRQEKKLLLALKKCKNVKYNILKKDFLFSHGFINNTKSAISYSQQILKFKDKYFDVIIIDGQARELCLRLSISKLKKNGFIIMDNSDRFEYKTQFELLIKNNFYRIDFWGLANYNNYETCTSIFFKNPFFLKYYNISYLKKYSPTIKFNKNKIYSQ